MAVQAIFFLRGQLNSFFSSLDKISYPEGPCETKNLPLE